MAMSKETQGKTRALPADQTLVLDSGNRLHYWDIGPVGAAPIVFIHGQGESREYWKSIINRPELQKQRCIVIDLLGYGTSDKPRNFDYSMEQHARTISEFLKIKKISKIIYVGHSMGGILGMDLLYVRPEIFQGIVLVDSALSTEYLLSGQFLKVKEWQFNILYPLFLLRGTKIVKTTFFENPDREIAEMGLRVMKQAATYAFLRSVKGTNAFLAKHDCIRDFKKLEIPHYFIYGTKDARVAEMINKYFAGEPYVFEVKGVKHCPMVEDPDTFCSVLNQILVNK
jgi:pimeloyl-ACP methyl ester carboxylesterase